MPRQILRGERGTTVIATAVAFAAILMLLSAVFQAVLWYNARSAALAAAQEGVRAARGLGASPAQGQAAACRYARTVGRGLLRSPACAATANASTVTVTVRGAAPSLIALFDVRVSEQARGAVERFTTPVNP